ncbi:branched-chain amino acid ABC transporter permease [Halococcus dombrowskii]|uniref:Branched-chain amino acid ABC transporter permease n=1 Tax=Halococcus dombrowskii TaxID=179637 RepID=A0AAV3SC18_HALDO|nr:branched-chain amino acid ABC transporter permease [Halococcus dombrowskii]UOO94397.1 branched-chain amino acid ABC transporter permease [Halococcus dombrowskii]
MADESLTTDPAETDTDRSFVGSMLAPRYLLGVLGVVAFAAVPFVGISTTQLLVLIGALYFGMFAMSWDVVSGYTGEISFGHALFFAVGGYTSTLLNLELGLSPSLTIPAGVALAALAGVLIGVPALRIRGPYLSLITLVAPLILLQVFIIYGDVFGGELGLSSPAALVTADEFDLVVTANYYIALGLFLTILLFLFAVTRSNIGSVLTAIREDEDAVAAAGLNVAKFKVFAFVLSAAIGGLAGAMFVHTPVGSPRPSQLLALIVSIEVLIAAILGGMGTIVGAGLGGVFFYFANDLLNQQEFTIPLVNVGLNEASLLIFALLTMVLIYVLPKGVFPSAIRAGRRLLGRARGNPVATDGGHESDATTPIEQTADRYRRALEELEERIGDGEK